MPLNLEEQYDRLTLHIITDRGLIIVTEWTGEPFFAATIIRLMVERVVIVNGTKKKGSNFLSMQS